MSFPRGYGLARGWPFGPGQNVPPLPIAWLGLDGARIGLKGANLGLKD